MTLADISCPGSLAAKDLNYLSQILHSSVLLSRFAKWQFDWTSNSHLDVSSQEIKFDLYTGYIRKSCNFNKMKLFQLQRCVHYT